MTEKEKRGVSGTSKSGGPIVVNAKSVIITCDWAPCKALDGTADLIESNLYLAHIVWDVKGLLIDAVLPGKPCAYEGTAMHHAPAFLVDIGGVQYVRQVVAVALDALPDIANTVTAVLIAKPPHTFDASTNGVLKPLCNVSYSIEEPSAGADGHRLDLSLSGSASSHSFVKHVLPYQAVCGPHTAVALGTLSRKAASSFGVWVFRPHCLRTNAARFVKVLDFVMATAHGMVDGPRDDGAVHAPPPEMEDELIEELRRTLPPARTASSAVTVGAAVAEAHRSRAASLTSAFEVIASAVNTTKDLLAVSIAVAGDEIAATLEALAAERAELELAKSNSLTAIEAQLATLGAKMMAESCRILGPKHRDIIVDCQLEASWVQPGVADVYEVAGCHCTGRRRSSVKLGGRGDFCSAPKRNSRLCWDLTCASAAEPHALSPGSVTVAQASAAQAAASPEEQLEDPFTLLPQTVRTGYVQSDRLDRSVPLLLSDVTLLSADAVEQSRAADGVASISPPTIAALAQKYGYNLRRIFAFFSSSAGGISRGDFKKMLDVAGVGTAANVSAVCDTIVEEFFAASLCKSSDATTNLTFSMFMAALALISEAAVAEIDGVCATLMTRAAALDWFLREKILTPLLPRVDKMSAYSEKLSLMSEDAPRVLGAISTFRRRFGVVEPVKFEDHLPALRRLFHSISSGPSVTDVGEQLSAGTSSAAAPADADWPSVLRCISNSVSPNLFVSDLCILDRRISPAALLSIINSKLAPLISSTTEIEESILVPVFGLASCLEPGLSQPSISFDEFVGVLLAIGSAHTDSSMKLPVLSPDFVTVIDLAKAQTITLCLKFFENILRKRFQTLRL